MSLVFMPHSLKVMTSKSRQGSLTGYQLTPAILELKAQVSGDNTGEEPFEFLCLVPNKPDKIEILG
jgi:hypothetical protein